MAAVVAKALFNLAPWVLQGAHTEGEDLVQLTLLR